MVLLFERKKIMIYCLIFGVLGVILYFSGLLTQIQLDNVFQSIILIVSGILLFIAGFLRIQTN